VSRAAVALHRPQRPRPIFTPGNATFPSVKARQVVCPLELPVQALGAVEVRVAERRQPAFADQGLQAPSLLLFRRRQPRRILADALDRQLDEIAEEAAAIQVAHDDARSQAAEAHEGAARLRTAEDLLLELYRRREEAMSWDVKRQLVELLVVGIRVDTVLENGKEVPAAEVTYAFTPAAIRMGTRACSSYGASLVRTYRPTRGRHGAH
jgi:hypothetical protein